MFKLPACASLLLRRLEDHRMLCVVVPLDTVSITSNGQYVEVVPKQVFSETEQLGVKTTEFILNCRFNFQFSSSTLLKMSGNLQDCFMWWNHWCESQNDNGDGVTSWQYSLQKYMDSLGFSLST